MVAALHRAGLGVVMDVVYNHTYHSDSNLERTVPGYWNRRWPNDQMTNGSGCGCDLASERPMVRKYIVDSILYWAQTYHIDGFRFDLMALEDARHDERHPRRAGRFARRAGHLALRRAVAGRQYQL